MLFFEANTFCMTWMPCSEEVPHVQLKTIDLPADQSLAELLPVEAPLQGAGMVSTPPRMVRTSGRVRLIVRVGFPTQKITFPQRKMISTGLF